MTKEPIIKIMETAEKLEAAQKKIEELKKKYAEENEMGGPNFIPTQYEEGYINGRQEAAKEIFDDIANIMVLQHGFNENHIVAHIDFELLKELKKKYTEGTE